MRITDHRRILGMVALLPLLLVSVAAGRYDLFRCHFTEVASVEECCPGLGADRATETETDTDAASAPAAATMTPATCCTRETVALRSAPSEPPTSARPDLAVPVGTYASLLTPAPGDARPRRASADGHGLPRTPILLVKRSLLI